MANATGGKSTWPSNQQNENFDRKTQAEEIENIKYRAFKFSYDTYCSSGIKTLLEGTRLTQELYEEQIRSKKIERELQTFSKIYTQITTVPSEKSATNPNLEALVTKYIEKKHQGFHVLRDDEEGGISGVITEIVKNYFSTVQDDSTFDKPSTIVEREIDETELNENHRVMLANIYMPERYKKSELFSSLNLPNDISDKFTSLEKLDISSFVEDERAIIKLNAKSYLTYDFIIDGKVIKQITSKSGEETVTLPLKKQKQTVEIEYYYTLDNDIRSTEKINFIKSENTKKSHGEKWFI